jgi:predicted O-methyltransferase YrrM
MKGDEMSESWEDLRAAIDQIRALTEKVATRVEALAGEAPRPQPPQEPAKSDLKPRPADRAAALLAGPILAVEVGVQEAIHAEAMASVLPLGTLYLVDHYAPYQEPGYQPNTAEKQNAYRAIAETRMKPFGDKTPFMVMTSVDAAAQFQDDSLDYVYIDGHHADAKTDIAAWWPKVKKGGILGGHDYTYYFPCVQKAVNEFVGKELALRFEEEDWWVLK